MPNPLFPGQYADPEIHVFRDRYWIYPTFSAPYEEQTRFEAWSSADLVEWRHEGKILDFADVAWSTNRAAWAPTAGARNGKYYLIFSAGDGAGLGVAVADEPGGPFVEPLGRPLVKEYHHGAQPIDAHLFQDDDGTPYLYWGGWSKCVVARMTDDLLAIEGDIREITPPDYVEGPFMLKHNGVYVLMWSEGGWGDGSYQVAYGRSDSPYGPFVREGLVLRAHDEIASSAGHHSVLQLPGTEEFAICYHRRPLGITDRHHRVTCLDRMVIHDDGTIDPVVTTHEGVGAWTVPTGSREV